MGAPDSGNGAGHSQVNDGYDEDRRDHEQAFEDFYRSHADNLINFAYRMGPTVDSKDVVQEVMTKMLARWSCIEGSPLAYAYVSVRNSVKDRIAEQRRQQPSAEFPEEQLQRALVVSMGDIDTRQRLVELWDRIDRLPERLREAVMLKVCGFDIGQSAEAMNCSRTTVSAYLSRAKQLLRESGYRAGHQSRRRHDDGDDV